MSFVLPMPVVGKLFAVGAVWVVNFDRGARAGADGCSALVTHFVVEKIYIVSHGDNICLDVL